MDKLKVLDLFSGIGGFSLGLERTGGFETVAFCEIDPFCQRVLAKHWPTVPCFKNITTLRGKDVGPIDAICGGFPCQDISLSGLGEGLDGARSGLWKDCARLIGELRPSYVLVENVAALLGRGIDVVLGDLASLGYDAEWHCIPASAIGAKHGRDRVWIVAYPQRERSAIRAEDKRSARPVRDGHRHGEGEAAGRQEFEPRIASSRSPLADAISAGLQGAKLVGLYSEIVGLGEEWASGPASERRSLPNWRGWATEPDVGRVADGVPDRAHRLKALGNAVVPQIPELIGRAILESERLAA